jgi:hypothetical protein
MSTDKKVSPVAYIFLFLGTAITGSALSFIYLWINGLKILPIDWLYVLMAVAVGAAMGFVSTQVIKLFKIKSVIPAVAMVVLGCLVFTYFKWALYVAQDADKSFSYVDEEGLYSSVLFYRIINNEFTDANNVPYDLEATISDMQQFTAYEYGILENTYYWGLWGINPAVFDRRDIRHFQGISYYEALLLNEEFGNAPRTAAMALQQYFDSTEYAYVGYFYEHESYPTAVYYMQSPAVLIDTIIRINGEGRWTLDDRQVTGIMLWLVWLAEFIIICGYAVIAAPKAINKLDAVNQQDVQAAEYNGSPATNPLPEVNQDNQSFPQPPADWGSGGFGGASEAPEKEEEFDEQGRPLAKADEFGRLS